MFGAALDGGALAGEPCVDGRDQFVAADRFGEIIVGPKVHAGAQIGLLAFGGQKDERDGSRGRIPAQAFADGLEDARRGVANRRRLRQHAGDGELSGAAHLGSLALRDVADVPRKDGRAALDVDARDGQLDRELLAGPAHGGDFDALTDDGIAPAGQRPPQSNPVLLAQLRWDDQLRHLPPERLFAGVAEGLLRRGIEIHHAPRMVDGHDAIQGDGEDGGLQRLARAQRSFSARHALGGVSRRRHGSSLRRAS